MHVQDDSKRLSMLERRLHPHSKKKLIQNHFDMAASGHRSASSRMPAHRLMVLVLLCLCRWLGSDGASSPLQVHVAAPIPRAVWEPPKLDAKKLKDCAPKLLEAGQLKALIAEARDPQWNRPKKCKWRRSPERPGLWRCPACEEWLPKTAFTIGKTSGKPDSYCKGCQKEKSREHYRTLRGLFPHLLGQCQV